MSESAPADDPFRSNGNEETISESIKLFTLRIKCMFILFNDHIWLFSSCSFDFLMAKMKKTSEY